MRILCGLLATAFVLGALGCGFDSEWRALEGADTPGITGRWIGRWESKVNGHNGDLRAIVTPAENGEYDVWYKATWGKVLSGDFRVTMLPEPAADRVNFTGAKDLGQLMGGLYQYRGWANEQAFYSTYTSEDDQGTFQMQRPN